MRLLKPGEPCPCCRKPIKEGLPAELMLYLSWLAEGMQLEKTSKGWEER